MGSAHHMLSALFLLFVCGAASASNSNETLIECVNEVEVAGNETCLDLQLAQGLSDAALLALNPGLTCEGTLERGTIICVAGNLTEPGCLEGPEWPEYLPRYGPGPLLDSLVAQRCPDNGNDDADFAAAKLCCTGEPSVALASAIGAGFTDCSSTCVLNPTSSQPGEPHSWYWNAVDECWVEDAGFEHCDLPDFQRERFWSVANESYALHLLLQSLAAEDPAAAEAQDVLLSALANGTIAEQQQAQAAALEIIREPGTLSVLAGLPAGSPLLGLQAEMEAAANRTFLCEVVKAQELSTAAQLCMCSPQQPYLYCHFLVAPEQQAFVARAAAEFFASLQADDGSTQATLTKSSPAAVAAAGAPHGRGLRAVTLDCPLADAGVVTLGDSLVPFSTDCALGLQAKCCATFIPEPVVAVKVCAKGMVCLVEVDVSQLIGKALKRTEDPACIGEFSLLEESDIQKSLLSLYGGVTVDACLKFPWADLFKRLLGKAAGLAKPVLDMLDPELCFAQLKVKYYPITEMVKTKLAFGVEKFDWKGTIGKWVYKYLANLHIILYAKLDWVHRTPEGLCGSQIPGVRKMVRCQPYCTLEPGITNSYVLRLGVEAGIGSALLDTLDTDTQSDPLVLFGQKMEGCFGQCTSPPAPCLPELAPLATKGDCLYKCPSVDAQPEAFKLGYKSYFSVLYWWTEEKRCCSDGEWMKKYQAAFVEFDRTISLPGYQDCNWDDPAWADVARVSCAATRQELEQLKQSMQAPGAACPAAFGGAYGKLPEACRRSLASLADSAYQATAYKYFFEACKILPGTLQVSPSPGQTPSGGGCTPDAVQREGDFYNQEGGLCSLANTGSPLARREGVASADACCTACSTTSGCTAYNFCSTPGGCFLPGLEDIPGNTCLLYTVGSALEWQSKLAGRGCGTLNGWFTGLILPQGGPQAGCPSSSETLQEDFYNEKGGLCSLGNLGSPIAVALQKVTPQDCCAACASTPGCNTWNHCGGVNGCFLPNDSTDSETCYLYTVLSREAWLARRLSTGCGAAAGWTTGFLGGPATSSPPSPKPSSPSPGPTSPSPGPTTLAPFKLKPCPSAPAGTTCRAGTDAASGLEEGCCLCRKTKASEPSTVYPSNTAATYYGYIPYCSMDSVGSHPPLPPNTIVHYTGAKLLGYDSNGCAKGDYAEVLLEVEDPSTASGTAYQTFWVLAGDLTFCSERSCGTKVELGASCQGVGCCTVEAEGGHPQAVCYYPHGGSGQCGVPLSAGLKVTCEPGDEAQDGWLCSGYPLSITEGESALGVCASCGGEATDFCDCLACADELDYKCPEGYTCSPGNAYNTCVRA